MPSLEVPVALTGASATCAAALAGVRAGRIAESLPALAALHARGATADDPVSAALVAAALLDCHLARGALGEAIALGTDLDGRLDLPGTAGAVAHHARGELSAALGEDDLAVEHATTAGGRLAAGPPLADPALVPWRAGAALALVRVGRRREAAALATEWYAVAVAAGSPYAEAHALRTLATVDSSGNRVATLRRARATLGDTPAARLAAQVDTDLAGLLLLDPSPATSVEALALLRSAEEYAGHQELWPLQGRVRRLLDRLGEPPRRVQSEALAALTAAERRVARLAADGLTNRQIAEQLLVTIKAVEWHLSHVYRKLGIASRTRLATTFGAPA
ncbi:helix-turn-helix transcriptional regulator [Nocardioides dongkuii]|uniref:helix-turn-helix transcriptional regulator n=1 Tax=Nocardioides dongkuii TaxID=2760089 RepID=UPI0015FD8CE5|nr:LuxR C-terminal-related transcriptional regulator [Nocardioides dongkuii]